MQRRAAQLALRVSVFYTLVASAWILFSDRVLETIAPDTQTYSAISTFKGWGFVFMTAALLYLTLRRVLPGHEQELAERKLMQQRLADLARFPDENPSPVLRVQDDGTILYANGAGQELLKIWGAGMKGLAPRECREWVQHALATGQPEEKEATYEGRQFRFVIAPTPANSYANLYARDVTERARTEQLLREREEQYRKVVEISTDAIFIMQDGRFALLNPSALKLFGADQPNQLLGKPVFDFIHEDFHDVIRERVRQAEQQDQPLPLLEEKLLKLDGSTVEVEACSTRFQFHDRPALLVEARDITTRKQSEKALRLFRDLIDRSNDAFEVVDPATGRYLDMNQTGCKDLGYTREELQSLRVFDVDPMVRESSWPQITETLRQQGFLIFNGVHRRKDGTTFPVEVDIRLVRLDHEYFITVVRDVSERKQSEEKMRQLSQAVEQSPVSVVITDTKGHIEYVNRKFTAVTGYEPKEVLGKNPRILKSGESPVEMYQQLWATITAGGTWSGEFHNRKKNGELFWEAATISPVVDEAGKTTHFLAVKEDITDQKCAQAALHSSEERLRLLIENASDLISVINSQGIIRFQSPSAERLLGYTPSEMVGRSAFEFIHLEDAARVAASLRQAVNQPDSPVSEEFRFRHRDGTWRILQSVGKTIPNHGGEGFIVVNSRDITESRMLEEEFRQAQKMESVGQLAAGVAHDFNNILAVIQLQAGMLKADQTLSPQQLEFGHEIEKAAQRAADLTRQLLLFSRKQTLHQVDVNLNDIVNNITKMLRRVLGEGIELQFKSVSQPLLVHVDIGMMDQVLLNLAVNARDAMPGGGRLFIETAAVEFDQFTAEDVSRARHGLFTCLNVTDTGCGIPAEHLPRIFDPFFTTKDVGKGTGLGLATVFGIVQQHHGWINVSSEPGRGTTFQIYLPRLLKPSDKTAAWASLASARGGTETILLAEDDSSLRASVQSYLTRLGYSVLEAPNGVAALEIWKQRRDHIQLLLTDSMMPEGMSGKDLARQLQKDDPALKVIYTSGYSPDLVGSDVHLQEGTNFLTKPFEAHKLAEAIRKSLDN